MTASKRGALVFLLSALWLILLRIPLWNSGYTHSILTAEPQVFIVTVIYLILAGALWIRIPSVFRFASLIAGISVVLAVAGAAFAGGFQLLDYPIIVLQLLGVYFAFHAHSEYTRAKSKAVHPMDYPVYG